MVKYISSLLSSINRIRRVIEVVITGLTRNQVIPNGTEGSNPSLSANKQDIAKAMSCFCFKLKRNSNPYNLLQDEVLSKEVYNRIVCVANSRANEVSRVPHSPPKKQDIAKAMSCFCFKLKREKGKGIRTLTIFCKMKSCQKKSIIG